MLTSQGAHTHLERMRHNILQVVSLGRCLWGVEELYTHMAAPIQFLHIRVMDTDFEPNAVHVSWQLYQQ